MSNYRYDYNPADKQIKRINAKILYISTSKYGGDWHSILHSHSCTELFYVVHGKGQFNLEGSIFPLQADDLLIVNPNVEHTELGLNAHPFEYITLGIDGMDFMFGEHDDERYNCFNCRENRTELLFYFNSLLKEIQQKPANYEVVCQNLLEVLITKIIRFTDFSINVGSGKKSSRECAMVKRYIESNFTENITLDTLANLTHMNKYYLVHTFRQENGVSPINYLIKRRIRESKHLLVNTNHSLSQISHMLGFSSPSYFSQSFKRMEKISPNEYRKKSRLKQQDKQE